MPENQSFSRGSKKFSGPFKCLTLQWVVKHNARYEHVIFYIRALLTHFCRLRRLIISTGTLLCANCFPLPGVPHLASLNPMPGTQWSEVNKFRLRIPVFRTSSGGSALLNNPKISTTTPRFPAHQPQCLVIYLTDRDGFFYMTYQHLQMLTWYPSFLGSQNRFSTYVYD